MGLIAREGASKRTMFSLASWDCSGARLPFVRGDSVERGAAKGAADGMVGGESERAGSPIAVLVIYRSRLARLEAEVLLLE